MSSSKALIAVISKLMTRLKRKLMLILTSKMTSYLMDLVLVTRNLRTKTINDSGEYGNVAVANNWGRNNRSGNTGAETIGAHGSYQTRSINRFISRSHTNLSLRLLCLYSSHRFCHTSLLHHSKCSYIGWFHHCRRLQWLLRQLTAALMKRIKCQGQWF